MKNRKNMVKKKIQDEKVLEAKRLISINEDSRQYFYEKADETWLKWLWENSFFDVLSKRVDDPHKFSFKMPELRYLVRMAELNPEIVTEIMLDTSISEETFNPEVIDQFLHICSCLPGKQLAKLVEKIKSENWPTLMQEFNLWDMGYGKMFENLKKSGYHEELMVLASVVLEFRDDWEIKAKEKYIDATPFCLTHLSYSRVFPFLKDIEENYVEDAIDLSLSVLQKLTTCSQEDQKNASVFKQKDQYPLYDVDIFTIGLQSEYHGSGREDVREVLALVKILTERFLAQKCSDRAKEIFEQKFESLPDSWLMWRIRLYVLSLCPSELMPQLKEAIFRIFKEEQYSELIMGTEYLKTLKKVFPLMLKEDQENFISLAKELFSHASNEDDESLKKRGGSRIFSVIGENLSEDQVTELVNAGFEINLGYVPVPIFQMGEVGFVNAKGPVNQDELRSSSVSTILDNLKSIWSPDRLIEQDIQGDFLNPLNAEGMGKLIKGDVKTRIQEYLEHANEFLEQEKLDLHYLYSLLSGFTDAISENTEPLKDAGWQILIAFCLQLIQFGNEQPADQLEYERNENNTWLAGWNAVIDAMTSLLKKVLGENGKKLGFKWESHRQDILLLIKYLFDYPDPLPEDKQIKSAKMTESLGDQKSLVSDPFTLAINSIRGQAFELFLLAVDLDSENNKNLEKNKMSTDLKKLYEYLLCKENTRAIMFMFGHYLPFFFYRDKNWLKTNLSKIFPVDEEKKYLFLAAWEGYISNDLYVEIFEDEEIQKLYKKAIVMSEKDYPQQKHFKNPDEGLAQHIALAYMVTDFDFGNELFDYFWTNGCISQHIAFVDMLGRAFISSENPKALKNFDEDKNAEKKIKNMWNWLLDNYPDSSVFNGIGFWVGLDKGIFKADELSSFLARTLVKTDGYLKWENGLQDNIVEFAKSSPEDTIEIARLYLLEGGVRRGLNSPYFFLDEKWVEAFQILYTQPATKQATFSLINALIQEGGSYFWRLKEVLENS